MSAPRLGRASQFGLASLKNERARVSDGLRHLSENTMPQPDAGLSFDLRTEKAELDRRESALEAREAAVRAASDLIDRRMAQLETLNTRLAGAASARVERSEAAWVGLVKVYEAMRPEDAATIFNGLDMQTLLQLLDRMNERKAASVLAAMQPERARVATQMLAERRLRESDVSDPAPASAGGAG